MVSSQPFRHVRTIHSCSSSSVREEGELVMPRPGSPPGRVSGLGWCQVDVADRMEAGARRRAVLSWVPAQYDIHLGRPCNSWSRPYSLGFSFWTLQRTHGSSRGPTLSLCSGPFGGEWRGEAGGPAGPHVFISLNSVLGIMPFCGQTNRLGGPVICPQSWGKHVGEPKT